MDKQFDIETKNRHSPYKVPDGFYDTLRKEVSEHVFSERSKRSGLKWRARIVIAAAIATAASLILLLLINNSTYYMQDKLAISQLRDLERDYDNLSEDDQELILEVYQDDIFLSK